MNKGEEGEEGEEEEEEEEEVKKANAIPFIAKSTSLLFFSFSSFLRLLQPSKTN